MYYIYNDQLNTPRVITNQQNQVVWRWDNNDPFGANIPDDDANNTGNHFTFNPRFPGQYADRETGIHYNFYRDYDPNIGRYIQSDPIGLVGGSFSTYLYVEADPLGSIDLLGLCKIEVRFKPIPGGKAFGIYHAYIVTTDPGGSQNYFRGGPDVQPNVSSPFFGKITTESGPYVPGTKDFDAGSPPSTTILDDAEPCGCYNQRFANVLNQINAAAINYIPAFRNSNSVAGTTLRQSGFDPGTPPVTTPGYSTNLQRYLQKTQ